MWTLSHYLESEFIANVAHTILKHKPEYLAYMLIDEHIPLRYRVEDVLYEVKKSEEAQKRTCSLYKPLKLGQLADDPLIAKFGISLTPTEENTDEFIAQRLRNQNLLLSICKSESSK